MTSLILLFFAALALLAVGADRFIVGATALGRAFKWPPLVIGILLVGLGSAFPEIIVSFFASIHHHPNLAVGNAVGSTIVNIALVLGITAMIRPIKISTILLRRDLPALLIAALIVGVIFSHRMLSVRDGALLLALLCLYWCVLFWCGGDGDIHSTTKTMPSRDILAALGKWLLGLFCLFFSAKLLVHTALLLASALHFSQATVGLSILAIGTALPELATCVLGVIRKEDALVLGNVVGSSVYNLLAVIAMPALFAPGILSMQITQHAYPMMLGVIALLALVLKLSRKHIIGRTKACILLLVFIVYLTQVLH